MTKIFTDKSQLKEGRKYSHAEVILLIEDKYRGRPKRKPAKSFSEMTDKNQEIFLILAKQIQEKFPDAVIYAGGSRMNGDWIEASDYDLNIYLPPDKWDEVRKMKFEYKACLHFKLPQGVLIKTNCLNFIVDDF